ncbi:MAG: VanZ family protein [Bacilli bacterium]
MHYLEMFRLGIFVFVLLIVVSGLVLVLLVKGNKMTRDFAVRTFFLLSTTIFTICITIVPTSSMQFGMRSVSLVPLQSSVQMLKVDINRFDFTVFFRNVFGNMALFLPFVFGVQHFFQSRKRITIFICFLFSVVIESGQYVVPFGRVVDIDDVLFNTIGAVIGAYFYQVCSRYYKKYRLKAA